MAGSWNKHAFVFCVITSLFVCLETSKLNVPRVLLPIFSSFSLNFTLEATESGCYKWSTSRPDIVQVLAIDSDSKLDCSSKAIVSTLCREPTRNAAIVFAEEIHSGQILRCDVLIDTIASLNVVTTSRELFMEEAPEAFEVRAYDLQGNEFTTLEGIEFEWTLGSKKSQGIPGGMTSRVLRIMTFKDSPYETPPTVKSLDDLALQGHMILLEGLKAGAAKVSVKLPYDEYADICAVEVQLVVMSNLIIVPADVHLLRGDTVKYSVLQVQQGRLEKIHLPSQQYYLNVENTSIATLDPVTIVATCHQMGKTQILLHDRNVGEAEGGVVRVPSASLMVADPAYLTLTILPHRNWAVLIGDHYEIIVEVYDSEHHKFHIGDDVEIQTLIPREYFNVEFGSTNGTYHYGSPQEVGTAQVQSTLVSVVDPRGEVHPVLPKISVQANLMIYQRIAVYPADVVLPWDPVGKPKYEVNLRATGGDGMFVWRSDNTSRAVVTQSGLVQTNTPGYVEISAAMSINFNNHGISRFHILPPYSLQIVEYMLETEQGNPIFLHLAVFAKRILNMNDINSSTELIPFTQCKDLPFHIRAWDESFVYNSSLHTAPVGISCAAVAVVANSVGMSKVTVSYKHEGGLLEDSVTVASYRPLLPLHPSSGETVLAVGSSRQIVFVGGPRPWLGRPSEHIRIVDAGGENSVVEVTEVLDAQSEHKDVFVYTVLCKQLGESEVTLTVTNKPVVKHCRRSESTATVRVLCAKPRFIILQPQLNLPEGTVCPLNFNLERMVAQNYRNVEVTVVVKDDSGRSFDNITSLQIDWWLCDDSLAYVSEPESTLSQHVIEDNVILPFRHYQVFTPKLKSGVLEITATVVGYQTEVLRVLNIVPEFPSFAILDEKGYEVTPEIMSSLSLVLVNDTVVTPNVTTLFNHPNNKLLLKVSQGSGFYDFVLSSEEVADVLYKEGIRIIEVIPKANGVLKVALIDLCLPSRPAITEIQVLSVGSISVDLPERVEKGRCISGIVRMYDSIDNLLPIPDPELLDLRPIMETGIISVKMQYDKDKNSKAGEIPFIVTGEELGEKRLVFVSGQKLSEVRSNCVLIQVFPPLRLLPRNVTLIVGSVFQISSRGGPQPDANVEFFISGSAASVSKKGIVEGLSLGNVVLVGRAVGYNRATGQRIIYTQDSIDVHVVPLLGIKIHTPLVRLINGATMPVWAHGIPDQLSPLILGSVPSNLSFSWSLSFRDIASLKSVYNEIGILVPNTDLITMRFNALKPGRTTIFLNVTAPGGLTLNQDLDEVIFQSSVDIQVFEELRLIDPANAGEQQSPYVLLAPDSEIQLKTNHEGQLTYKLLGNPDAEAAAAESVPNPEDLSRAITDHQPILTVSQNGMIQSHSTHGRAVVMVAVKEEFGLKQMLSVTVEVKPIHYLMVNFKPSFYVMEGETVTVLPIGGRIETAVSYHDNTGDIFTATRTEVKLRINRFDLAKLEKSQEKKSLHARLMYGGTTMVKVWDDLTHQHASDFIKLSVGDVILPLLTFVTVGDIICFSIPLVSIDGRPGIWDTDNPAVLKVNPELGIGRARAAGSATVYHSMTFTSITTQEFKVLPIFKVKILPMRERYITNSDPEAVFKIPLVLRNELDKNKMTSMISRNGSCPMGYVVSAYPFYCSMHFTNPDAAYDIDDVFAVHQDFDQETGEYTCSIVASGDPPPNLSSFETNVSLSVESVGILSSPVVIRFLPAIYVSTPEIHLSDTNMAGTLIVSGIPEVLDEVEVIPSYQLLSVSKPERTMGGSANSYRVQLSETYWTVGELSARMNISVFSQLTRQTIQVPLMVHLGGDKYTHSPCLVSHVGTWGSYISDLLYAHRHTLIIIGSLFIIVVAGIYCYSFIILPMNHIRTESLLVNPSLLHMTRQLAPAPSVAQPRQSFVGSPRAPFMEGEPVYGDPRLYSCSPDLRRTRRPM